MTGAAGACGWVSSKLCRRWCTGSARAEPALPSLKKSEQLQVGIGWDPGHPAPMAEVLPEAEEEGQC